MIHDIPQPIILIAVLAAVLTAGAFLARNRTVVVRVPAQYESIRTLAQLLGRIAGTSRLGEQETFACRLALDEACVNIIEHAYANEPGGEIEVMIQGAPGMCIICLTDFGQPYDPQKVPRPRFAAAIEEASPGGLGLHLMRTMMDDVQYVVSPYGNSLIMVKRSSLPT